MIKHYLELIIAHQHRIVSLSKKYSERVVVSYVTYYSGVLYEYAKKKKKKQSWGWKKVKFGMNEHW